MPTHTILRNADLSSASLTDALRGATGAPGILRLFQLLRTLPPDARPHQLHIPAVLCKEVAAAWDLGHNGVLRIVCIDVSAELTAHVVLRSARSVASATPTQPLLAAMVSPGTVAFVTLGIDSDLKYLALEPSALLASDLDILRDLAPAGGEAGIALFTRIAAALDGRAVTTRFFKQVRVHPDAISEAWLNIPRSRNAERDQLALLVRSYDVLLLCAAADASVAAAFVGDQMLCLKGLRSM